MQEINIEEIMQEIRNDIKEKGYQASDLNFQDIPLQNGVLSDVEILSLQELKMLLYSVHSSAGVDFYHPITDGGLKGFIKKCVRKLVKPLLFPLCQQQEAFNSATAQALDQLLLHIESIEKRVGAEKHI